jgi:hypothetical protein
MDETETTFRFAWTRTLPLMGSFLFLLLIVIGGLVSGSYNPIVSIALWLALISSGWLSLSDLLTLVILREGGLQIRSLTLRGLRTRLISWTEVQALGLSGHQPDALKLRTREGVSVSRWTLPAHPDLAQAVVRRAGLQPSPDNQPPGVQQAFGKLRETKSRQQRFLLFWQWARAEDESGEE